MEPEEELGSALTALLPQSALGYCAKAWRPASGGTRRPGRQSTEES